MQESDHAQKNPHATVIRLVIGDTTQPIPDIITSVMAEVTGGNRIVRYPYSVQSGHGVDEKSFVSILGKWEPEHRQAFRKGTPYLFVEDERQFEKWDDRRIILLKHEFMRFKKAVVLWTMHPWERDARLAKKALKKGTEAYGLLVEITCTRSSEELLGARRAYHSLFDHSIEEDIVSDIPGIECKLLVALVSAYRYEGSKIKDKTTKSEAKTLSIAIKNDHDKPIIEEEEVIRILATRSKPHLKAIHKHYKEICGKNLDEDLDDLRLKKTVQCLCTPQTYFSEVLDEALKVDVDKDTKNALTRVIVTRADTNMKAIKDEYQNLYEISLSQKIEDTANGNFKDFLLALVARGG